MRRTVTAFALVALASVFALGDRAAAQAPNGLNVQRDCQTVRTCNFARGATVRGCLSSFSCRQCKPVAVRCTLPGTSACQELRCSWGA